MVVLVVHGVRVFSCKFKRDSPVSADGDCPSASLITFERVQGQSGKCQVLWSRSGAEAAKDQAEPGGVLSLDACGRASFKKPCQTFVPESTDHREECNQLGYRMQGGYDRGGLPG